MKEKSNLIKRVYLFTILLLCFGIAVLYKALYIQLVEGEKWIAKANNLTTKVEIIEAERGNIYASDGSLLATSLPYYEIRIDLKADGLTDEIFYNNIDSLAYCLAALFKDKSTLDYKRQLVEARNRGERYHLIKRNVKYRDLTKLRHFPIIRLGRYKGGVIYFQQSKRELPFQQLAARTIGYDKEGVKPVGLEGAYRSELGGVSGRRLMQKIAGGVWMPINDEIEIEPEDGTDLISTLDINIQDVAQNALLKQLKLHNADHGCVVLMEVKTGEVKAITNLTLNKNGTYSEKYNYAIGESTEPGSTFKLVSILAAIEDGFVDINDSIDTEDGTTRFYDRTMADSHKGGYGKITLKRSFEVSSNVAISKVINSAYAKNPAKFIERLHAMSITQPLGIEIYGEGKPMIKEASDKSWSGISLPWMSIGYEVQLTPLQILTFYNAVANDGVMVKPRFVKEISKMGRVIKRFDPVIINNKIASKESIAQVREMLEGVIENGTAVNLKNANYKIAGKTGTAQIANAKYGYKYERKVSHQASFVGYFPADNPKYTCIVVVNAPSRNVYYGNLVAGPIFKEIADKVYSTSIEIHKELDNREQASITKLPVAKDGYRNDLLSIYKQLGIPTLATNEENHWVNASTGTEKVELKARKVESNLVPNVVGMDLQNAIYLLENMGINVKFQGRGAVKTQSVLPGNPIYKGSTIYLTLNT
jgi:cell division protein FtsI (penicillin-binding protein 3)